MGDGFQFLDIILFAAVAAFLVLRLRNVLGRRTGHQGRPKSDPFRGGPGSDRTDDKVIPLPDRSGQDEDAPFADEASSAQGDERPLAASLTRIKLADSSFEEGSFLNGARAAFEMVINAFAQGDTKVLRPLLSNDVYDDFAGAIKVREDGHQSLETTLVGFNTAEIIEAELQGKTAFVTTKFVTEQVNVTRDDEGTVVDGDPNQVTQITDIWTFARNTRSRDPNWTLVATRSPH